MKALHRDAALTFLVCGAGGGLLSVTLAHALSLDWHFNAVSALVYVSVAAIVLTRLAAFHPYASFGAPNRVTTVRAAITALFAGLAATAQALDPHAPWLWLFALLAALALVLDGVDGWVSRRTEMASDFGARYDMEIDALLILLLAIVAWRMDKAGAWILAIGALRYVFVAAGRVWRWLEAPLPPAAWRKAICVVQGVVLCALIAPPFAGMFSRVLAAAALFLLLASFGVDVRWLHRRARRRTVPVNG